MQAYVQYVDASPCVCLGGIQRAFVRASGRVYVRTRLGGQLERVYELAWLASCVAGLFV